MTGDAIRAAEGDDRGIDRKILEIFREASGGIVSGETLSKDLNVSRTAVWKHIKALRNLGYQITAVPSQGYRLIGSPDILTPPEISAGLRVESVGSHLVCLRETESTNVVAYRLAAEGAAEGTVVIADSQSRGKGRLGRAWESPQGVNLYCSVILRPAILPHHAPQLTFLSAVAVAEAIERTTPLVPAIKWPNDVLINGRKVAGTLNEMSAETERVEFIILGVGVNINMRREQFPASLRHPATSLAIEGGGEVERVRFLRAFLESLDRLYHRYRSEGYEPLRQAWLSRSVVMGRRVSVAIGEGSVKGVVTGIDEIGALLLQTADGGTERILSGDVTVEE
ncbi:biotin--[acetyl-CoA-carboxylase] ligase [Geobacter pickeringii]|uniref:Bifunctional ligase/repressor BirA n=1 Tax=Geobacter pickeringii TaxID=345632 RepID=A0A0B5BG13_9BACT|nr:biotin--[acetyl-CoA-carboxylase] ligase [Geobacter pickeringii]AJE03460.1 biotin--acetyl-CoA carboxylase ligase [Geobacter pickeringii]